MLHVTLSTSPACSGQRLASCPASGADLGTSRGLPVLGLPKITPSRAEKDTLMQKQDTFIAERHDENVPHEAAGVPYLGQSPGATHQQHIACRMERVSSSISEAFDAPGAIRRSKHAPESESSIFGGAMT